jgi:hypothetical protein
MEKFAKKPTQHKGGYTINIPKSDLKKLIKQEISGVQEKKSFDAGVASTFDNTGSITKLTTIPQGDTDSSRDGDHIKLHSIWCNGAVNYSDTTNVIRLIIFRWNQDDSSAAPTVNDITQTFSPFSPIHRDNERAKKFDVVYDHLFGVANVGPGIQVFQWRKRMQSIVAFQATANTGTGHLYAFVISDSSATPHPGLSLIWRTYYTDS